LVSLFYLVYMKFSLPFALVVLFITALSNTHFGQRTTTTKEGDYFPKETLWLNSNGNVSFQELKDKYVVVLVNDIRNLEGSYCAKALEILSAKHYETQFIHMLVTPTDAAISRTDILHYIQQHNYHHPIGILPDFKGFTTSAIQELPYFLVYDRSNTPIYQGAGINALLEIEQLVASLRTLSSSKSYSHYQVTSSIKPTDWANPLIELPTYIASQLYGNGIYVNDVSHHRILGINRYGECETVDGSSIMPGYDNEQEGDIFFQHAGGIATDGELLYVADTYNNRIRQVNRDKMQAITINGNGRLDSLALPTDIAFWKGKLYALDGLKNQVLLIHPDKKTSKLFAQLPNKKTGMNRIYPINLTAGKKLLYVAMSNGEVWTIDKKGRLKQLPAHGNVVFSAVCEWNGGLVAVSPSHNGVYFMKKNQWQLLTDGKDEESIRLGLPAFNRPYDLTVVNGELYVTDTYNHCIRVIHSPSEVTPHVFQLQLNLLLISDEPSHTYGQLVVMESIAVSNETTAFKVELDLEGYVIKPEGKNLVIMHESPEIGEVLTPEIKDNEFAFTVQPNTGHDAVYMECYLTLEHPSAPHHQIIKRAYLVFPIEPTPDAEAIQHIKYKPDLLPH
jgi:sugar lactone lactonase YvrE